MLLIPIGLIFVFFYINVAAGSRTVDILPDAVGYILIAVNARKFREKSDAFSRLVILCIVLSVYSIAVRLIVPTGLVGVLLSLLELLLQIYLLRLIVRGIEDLEHEVGAHLNAKLLDRWRLALTAGWVASYFGALLDTLLGGIGIVGALIAAAWAVLCVLFLIVLFRTNHRYQLLMKQEKTENPDQDE